MNKFIETKLTGDLDRQLAKFEQKVQEKVLFSGAAAMARVFYDEVKLNASPPRMGKVTGNLERSIYWAFSPEKSTDTQKTYRISWNKVKAPHGHLLEWGSSKMAAKPFVRPAFDHWPSAMKAGMERMKQRLEGVGV